MNGITINNDTMIIPYSFTMPFEPYYKLMRHVSVLIFDKRKDDTRLYRYEHQIVLVSTIKVLKIKRTFRYPIVLTPNIQDVELWRIDQCFILTPNITTLTLDRNSITAVLILTPNITTLTFGNSFNCPVVLSKNIISMSIGYLFDHLLFLNKKLDILKLLNYKSNKSISLSKYLTFLKYDQEQPLVLNKTLRTIMFYDYQHPLILSKHVDVFTVGNSFNQQIILNKSVSHLEFNFFSQPIILPKNVVFFGTHYRNVSHCDFVQTNILTSGIKTVCFMHHFNSDLTHDIFPNVLPIIKLIGDNLPNTVSKIISDAIMMFDNIPSSVKCFE